VASDEIVLGVFRVDGVRRPSQVMVAGGCISSTPLSSDDTVLLPGGGSQPSQPPLASAALHLRRIEALHSAIEALIDNYGGAAAADISIPFSRGDEITVAGPLFAREEDGLYATVGSYTRGVAQQQDNGYDGDNELCRAALALLFVALGVRKAARASLGLQVSCLLHSGVSSAALGQTRPCLSFFGPAERVSGAVMATLPAGA
jgi:hypothetical protein